MNKITEYYFRLCWLLFLLTACYGSTIEVYVDTTSTNSLGTQVSPYSTLTQALTDTSILSQGGIIFTTPSQTLSDLVTTIDIPSSVTITITSLTSERTELIFTSSAAFNLQSSSCLNLTNIDLQISSSSVLSSLFSVGVSAQLIISNSKITIIDQPATLLSLISGQSASNVAMNEVTMEDAFSSGTLTSLVSLEDNGFLNVSNSYFSNAELTGGTLFSIGESTSIFCNCVFEDFSFTTATAAPLISTQDSITLCNSSFKNVVITATAAVSMIQMTDAKQNTSTVEISNVTISNVATTSAALLFQNASSVTVESLTCSANTEGSCLRLEHVESQILSNVQIASCSSTTYAAGIVALYPNLMTISTSSFTSNIGFYSYAFSSAASLQYNLAVQGGVALFIYGLNLDVTIDSSTFNGNKLNSDPTNDLGGPSLVFYSQEGQLKITNSDFTLNSANVGSNNAAVVVYSLTMQNSNFMYNIPYTNATLSPTSNFGGALLFGAYVTSIQNCTFSNNHNYAGGAMYFTANKANMYIVIQVTMKDCSFISNGAATGGAIHYCDACNSFPAVFDNVTFSNNTGYYGGVLSVDYQYDACNSVFKNCRFMFNMAQFDGGVVLATNQGGYLNFESSAFIGNGAQGNGGVVRGFMSFNGVLSFTSCTFEYNQATSAAILYMQGMTTQLISSTFQNDQGSNAGVFFFEQSTVVMQHLYFYKETAAQTSLATVKGATRMQVANITFESCVCASQISCSIMSVSGYAVVMANVLNLTNNYIASGALLDFSKSSGSRADPNMNYFNSTYFSGNTGSGYIVSVDITKIFLDSMTLNNNQLQILWGSYSVLTLLQLTVSNHLCPNTLTSCLVYGESSTLYTLQSISIQNLTDTSTQGLAYIVNSQITIGSFSISGLSGTSPVFTVTQGNLTAGQGVVRYLRTTLMYAYASNIALSQLDYNNEPSPSSSTDVAQSSIITCQDCVTFSLISSSLSNQHSSSKVNGGALSITNSILPSTSFILQDVSISRFSGANLGGALYVQNSKVSVTLSKFTFNNANSGGAIYLNYDQSPDTVNPPVSNFQMTDSQLTQNTATSAGGAIYANVPTISLLPNQLGPTLNNVYSSNTAYYGDDFGLAPSVLNVNLFNQSSGDSICDYDHNKDICHIPDAASGQTTGYNIVLTLKDALGVPVLTNNGVQSSFSILTSSINGSTDIFQLSGQTVTSSNTGVFNYSELVVIGTPKTSLTLEFETGAIVAFSGTTQISFTHLIQVSMRECKAGEIYNSLLNTCDPCPAGSYSLNASDTECKACMDNAECLGGSQISVNPGYWRSNTSSEQIHYCGDTSSCLGGYYSNCSLGFTGPLCKSCDISGPIKYTKSGSNCLECASAASNITQIIFLILLEIAILAVFIKTSSLNVMKSGKVQQLNLNSASIKILMSYLQVISIVGRLNFNWPTYANSTIQVQAVVGNVQDQAVSFDCFLGSTGVNLTDYFSHFYVKVLIKSLIVYTAMLGAFAFWGFVRAFRKVPVARYTLASCIVIGFTMQPSIVTEMLAFLDCTEVDTGQKYVTNDMTVQCGTPQYNFWTYVLVYPNLFLWIFFLPFLVFWRVRKGRDKLEEDLHLAMKYGFLFKTYSHKYYYWEMVVFLRKVSILLVQVLASFDVVVQAIMSLFILLVCTVLQNQLQPFKTPDLNSLELWGLRMSQALLLAGLFFYKSQNDNAKMFVFTILLIPISFLAMKFVKIIYEANKGPVSNIIHKIKLIKKLGWKGYKAKMKEEKEAGSPQLPREKANSVAKINESLRIDAQSSGSKTKFNDSGLSLIRIRGKSEAPDNSSRIELGK